MKYLLTMLAALCFSGAAWAGERVTYEVDGAAYEGYHADAGEDAAGLVLIIHDWDGLTDYERKRAEMLAELGYDAFPVDLYGKGNRPVETGAKKAETEKLYNDRDAMRTLIVAGLSEARRLGGGNAVVMGYCFGGAATLELARSGEGENVAGYASFHGGLSTPEGQSYSADIPPILVAHGGADRLISMDEVAGLSRELEAAGTPYEIEVYSGARHAFTVFGSDRYQARADEKSWDAFKELLANTLAGS